MPPIDRGSHRRRLARDDHKALNVTGRCSDAHSQPLPWLMPVFCSIVTHARIRSQAGPRRFVAPGSPRAFA